MKNNLTHLLLTSLITILLCLSVAACAIPTAPPEYSGEKAYEHVKNQLNLGMRIPGTQPHAEVIKYISDALNDYGWSVEIQQSTDQDPEIQNIIASRNEEIPRIILGAHYDTREYADHDPDPANRTQPVPGANDGASGVAVLLEIARSLPKSIHGVTLLFIDAEDQGDINGQSWIRGSTYFVEESYSDPSAPKPEAAIIIDMIGDADLQLYYENNSDPKLREEIWSTASSLNYSEQFIPQTKYTMLDDHIPFKNAGIPAVDIIDFDYPYWHTIQDTSDKVSPQSLEAVGKTLLTWLENKQP